MPFCCKDDDDGTMPKRYAENRSCTDCLCLLLFVAFWGGFIAVAGVAYANGRPERLIYGTDYLGYVCGRGDAPINFAGNISAHTTHRWQSPVWEENKLLWYPLPLSSPADFNLDVIINSAICVKECPQLDTSSLTEIETHGVDFANYPAGILDGLKVFTYGVLTYDKVTTYAPEAQYVMYSSAEFFHRCIPKGLSPASVNATISQIPGATEVTDFFFRGFAEMGAAWRVFLITLILTFVYSFVYIFIMRFIVKVLVYIAIFLGFALLVLLGAAAYNRYSALKDANDPNDTQQQYVDYYLAAAIISWVASGLYLMLIIFMRKRISLACAIVKISGRVLASKPLLLIVPVVLGIFLLLVCAWSLSIGVYLYSAQDFTYKPAMIPVFDWELSNANNGSLANYVNIGGQWYANATTKINEIEFSRRDLVFYDLFGFLWTMGFVNAVGFMVVAFVTVFWYFSDLDDAKKEVPSNGIRQALWWTLRYHLGTLAFGSLIIAIIQFVRILMNYFYQQSKKLNENKALKVIMCVANCIMACFERIVQVISKNAYIFCAITNKAFCCAAKDSFNLVADNALTIFLLNAISEMVILFGKLVVVLGSVLTAYCLMKYGDLAPGVETYIFPLICIAFAAYFITVVFFNVYSVAVDANFVCYQYDRKVNAGNGIYYVPAELEEQISNYNKKAKLDEMQKRQAASHPAA